MDSYLDSLYVGIIWKIMVGMWVLYRVAMSRFLNPSLLLLLILVFKCVFTLDALENLVGNGYFVVAIISFLTAEFYLYRGMRKVTIECILVGASIAVTFIGILTFFGVIESFSEGYNPRTLGLFDNSQTAAKTYFLCALGMFSLIYYNSSYRKLEYYILLLTLLLFAIFSYVRTVWVLLIIFASYMVITNIRRLFVTRNLFVIFAGLVLLNVLIARNMQQIVDRIGYSEDIESTEVQISELSSGRNVLTVATIDVLKSYDFLEFMWGIGSFSYLSRFREYYGVGIFPHNRLLEFLVVTGLVGMSLFILYFVQLYKRSNTQVQRLILFLWLVSLMPSHGWGVYGNFLFILIYNYCDGKRGPNFVK